MNEDQPSEIDLMSQIDGNPKAHEESSPEEVEKLRGMYGDPDDSGNFTSPADEEEGAEE